MCEKSCPELLPNFVFFPTLTKLSKNSFSPYFHTHFSFIPFFIVQHQLCLSRLATRFVRTWLTRQIRRSCVLSLNRFAEMCFCCYGNRMQSHICVSACCTYHLICTLKRILCRQTPNEYTFHYILFILILRFRTNHQI